MSLATPSEDPNKLIEVDERRRLCGLPLVFMRSGWVLITLSTLFVFLISIPSSLGQLASLPLFDRITLENWGLGVNVYIYFVIILDVVTLLGFTIPAAIIFLSKSDDWLAALVSIALVTFGIGITSSLESLLTVRPALEIPITLIRGLGIATTLFVFYLFPDGRFIPHWTRPLALVWIVWLVAWANMPVKPIEMSQAHPLVRILTYQISRDPSIYTHIYQTLRTGSLLLVLLGWFGSGVIAQNHRYRYYSTPLQQQRTKWIVFGLTTAFAGTFVYYVLPLVFPSFRSLGQDHLFYVIIGESVYRATLLLVPISLAISVSIFKLWDIDYIINRTLVYGMLTTFAALVYLLEIVLVQYLFVSFTQLQSTIFVAITTMGFVILFKPLYQRIQNFIDRRFYRERVDFRQAFTSFSKQVRTIIDLPELLQVLVDRTTSLLHIQYGAVFLFSGGNFRLAEERDLEIPESSMLTLDPFEAQQLQKGNVVNRLRHPYFPMLVPLLAPQPIEQQEKQSLLGVLALGPQRSGLNYSRENRDLLMGLADQAGTAIYVAQLMQEKQAEVLRREQAERSLEIHRNSPLGKAESRAHALSDNPSQALQIFHQLAQEAGGDPEAASLLANLPNALNNLGETELAGLVESYNFLFTSLFTPELLPIGLRNLIARLLSPESHHWEGAEAASEIYQRCHLALEANSIAQILDLQPVVPKMPPPPALADLTHILDEFNSVTDILHAYARVDSSQDRLAYLASAVERLRHLDRAASTELGSADRAVAQSISESWLAIVTSMISELQTRSRLVFHLLTRHTWQVDIISLALNIRNEGRGAALNIKVTLAPDPAYTLLQESASIDRLAYDEEAQIVLRIRPHLDKGIDQFRARFVILYTDPRGPDQVENFADMIHLLTTEGQFQFIPNPYVVGTPLQARSPLFFGREDIIAFVKENLAASHRNNMVLIGQRRTGKTSLLKQLPARLEDSYLPVYIDGQALGLDPGLPNFFMNLATEIAFALEDHGFAIASPKLEDFSASPASAFEHDFLGRVRGVIGRRHLLIMLDEFEELETAVRRGDLEPSIFNFLRHLIQHTPDLSVIFCGTHRLEELASDYWNVLFNISIYRHIASLERNEAMRLVQEPVAPYGMRYDDLALDKIWRITAGQPYFLQLLCHSLVNHHNKTQRSYVTIADVNAALEEILASGEAHFVYLWTESTPLERVALTAMSRIAPTTGQITPVQIVDYLTERGVTIERQSISDALHHLVLRDVVSTTETDSDTLGESYRWKLGLLSMWVEKYKSMSRVIDEMKV